MRELEFLPAWYPQARRRQRVFRIQLLSTLLLLGGLALWVLLAQRNIDRHEAALGAVDSQLRQSQLEFDQLQVQLKLKSQLEYQRQIVSRLGLPVEMSRVVRTIDSLMPKEMSLVELSFDTIEEQAKAPGSASGAPSTKTRTDQPLDRRLRVRLLAVAPSDVDLANFLAGLTTTPFFQDVDVKFSRDKSDGGHLMREFEVTFSMSLNSNVSGN